MTPDEFQTLKEGDRVVTVWGYGTVRNFHFHPKPPYGNGSKRCVWIWHDDENVRKSTGYTHAGYVGYLCTGRGIDFADAKGIPNYIPTATCPGCEIEEMIFYEGDYICAWCREVFEDDLC